MHAGDNQTTRGGYVVHVWKRREDPLKRFTTDGWYWVGTSPGVGLCEWDTAGHSLDGDPAWDILPAEDMSQPA